MLSFLHNNSLPSFPPSHLDDLGEALLDFRTVADLQQWLSEH